MTNDRFRIRGRAGWHPCRQAFTQHALFPLREKISRIALLGLVVVLANLSSLSAWYGVRAQEQTLVRLDGEVLRGPIVDWTPNSLRIAAETPDADPIEVELSDVVRWGVRHDTAQGPQILLVDGSVLLADVLDIRRDSLAIGLDLGKFGEVPLWNDVTIPLKYVRAIVFRPPAGALDRDRLAESFEKAAGNADRLLLENGDMLEGTLTSAPPDQINDAPDSLWLRMLGRTIDIPRDKITAVLFNPTLWERPQASANATFGFRDGSYLHANSPEDWTAETDPVRLKHPSGVVFEVERERFLSQLVHFQPLNPRVRYLSDVEPANYRHVPFLEMKWPFGKDRSVVGGRLRFKSAIYPDGLGMHSASRLVYPLQAGDRTFEAELALDDQAGDRGSVQYEVLVLKEGGWERAYESPIVRGSDSAVLPIEVDVEGGRAIVLAVRYADFGDLRDYANWLGARITRAGEGT